MAARKKITLESLKAEIQKIKAKFPRPPDDPTYKRLKALYLLREQIGTPKDGPILDYVKEYHAKMHRNVQKTFFRVMIDLAADWTEPQLKSRYANALEFALEKKCPGTRIITFMKKQGGIKACDELYRQAHVQRRKKVASRKHK